LGLDKIRIEFLDVSLAYFKRRFSNKTLDVIYALNQIIDKLFSMAFKLYLKIAREAIYHSNL